MSKFSKFKPIWTVVHVSLAFAFVCTAFKALECVQSSLNFESGLGTISIGLVYIGYVFSSACIGAPVVSILTPKWSIFFCFFSHTLFILANVWPSWFTLPAASLILGVAAGPYWIAQGTYMTTLAVEYSSMTGTSLVHVAERFSSIFHVIWGIAGPLGNLVAAVILGLEDRAIEYSAASQPGINTSFNDNASLSNYQKYIDDVENVTTEIEVIHNCEENKQNLSLCGASHCPYMEAHLEVLEKPSQKLLYILLAIFLCFNMTGILLAACMDPVSASKSPSVCLNLRSSVKLAKKADMLLLLLPIFYTGMIPGIFHASFAQSFVSCAFSVSMVGYAMVAEGIGFTVASLICGPLASYVPRFIHMILSFAVFFGIGITWLIWIPEANQEWLVLAMSAIFGAMYGVHRTHIAGLVSSLFPDDPGAAFGHYNTWMGLSHSASFVYSSLLCFNVKDYIFLTVTVLTATSHFFLETRIWKRNRILQKVKERDEKDRKDMGELISISYKG